MFFFFLRLKSIWREVKSLVHFIYLRVNLFSISYVFYKILLIIDAIILKFLNILVDFYRIPRNLFFFFLFKPAWAFIQYSIVANWWIYIDVGYLSSHLYYLIVKSDIFNVKRKLKRSFWFVINLHYCCFLLIFSSVNSIFFFFYSFFFIKLFGYILSYCFFLYYKALTNLILFLYCSFVNLLYHIIYLINSTFYIICYLLVELFFFSVIPSYLGKSDNFYRSIYNKSLFDCKQFFSILFHRIINSYSYNKFTIFSELPAIDLKIFKNFLLVRNRHFPAWYYFNIKTEWREVGYTTLFFYLPIAFLDTIVSLFTYFIKLCFLYYNKLYGKFISFFFFFLVWELNRFFLYYFPSFQTNKIN